MAFELRDGQGNLFKNNKDGNEKRPDYRGELNIGGTVYRLSAWLKDGKKGKYMSLNAQPKEEREETAAASAASSPDPSDEIPF